MCACFCTIGTRVRAFFFLLGAAKLKIEEERIKSKFSFLYLFIFLERIFFSLKLVPKIKQKKNRRRTNKIKKKRYLMFIFSDNLPFAADFWRIRFILFIFCLRVILFRQSFSQFRCFFLFFIYFFLFLEGFVFSY